MKQHEEMMEKVMERVMDNVTKQVADSIRDVLAETLEKEFSQNLTKALVESEFYRKLSNDMRGGLQTIYKEISTATKSDKTDGMPPDQKTADKLFNEASQQLDEILVTTEKATVEIMEIVEKHMDMQARASEMLGALRKTRKSNPAIQELININNDLGDNLIKIMSALSFQDLTGQRIKLIITALKKIEAVVFDMYMSTGLIMKAREEQPERELEELELETKKKVSDLKGPQADASQQDIDDMLSQLGLE